MKNELLPLNMAKQLLAWYDQNCRALPWRMDKDPYHIWVSEIMLQQTRVEAATAYYVRFVKELPDVSALAHVSDERLLKLWEGLGYYSRAKNLKKAAVQMVSLHEGKLPSSYETLLTLPGIGPYTAGAVASIAFDVRVPAVDGNVLRVMARILASGADISKTTAVCLIRERLTAVMPGDRPGDFNQALMDLGAAVCLPHTRPRCDACPLTGLCQAFMEGDPMKYPVKSPKKPRKVEEKSVFIIESDGKYLLRKRPPKGLLAGMWEFPNIPGTVREEDLPGALSDFGFDMQDLVSKSFYKHIFTHVEWRMTAFLVKAKRVSGRGEEERWMTPHEMERRASIPSAFRAFMKMIRGDGQG